MYNVLTLINNVMYVFMLIRMYVTTMTVYVYAVTYGSLTVYVLHTVYTYVHTFITFLPPALIPCPLLSLLFAPIAIGHRSLHGQTLAL